MTQIITINEQSSKELQTLIRSEFDKSEFYNVDSWIDLAKNLGFETLADQMEIDAKNDTRI